MNASQNENAEYYLNNENTNNSLIENNTINTDINTCRYNNTDHKFDQLNFNTEVHEINADKIDNQETNGLNTDRTGRECFSEMNPLDTNKY